MKMIFEAVIGLVLLGLASTTTVTPAAAQAGCTPYVGGSCGYQDTHPPVPWRGQNRYYNGNGIGLPDGIGRGGRISDRPQVQVFYPPQRPTASARYGGGRQSVPTEQCLPGGGQIIETGRLP